MPSASGLGDDEGKALGRADFFVPGSILRVKLDTSHPLAMGMDEEIDVIFSSSPVFKIEGGHRLAWFDSATPPRSRRQPPPPPGPAARPQEPSLSVTSTSIVGLPRESRISRARTLLIRLILVPR